MGRPITPLTSENAPKTCNDASVGVTAEHLHQSCLIQTADETGLDKDSRMGTLDVPKVGGCLFQFGVGCPEGQFFEEFGGKRNPEFPMINTIVELRLTGRQHRLA